MDSNRQKNIQSILEIEKNVDRKAIGIYIYYEGCNKIENGCPQQLAFLTKRETRDRGQPKT